MAIQRKVKTVSGTLSGLMACPHPFEIPGCKDAEFLELAKRCEQATGPDIQLDADIRNGLDLPHDYRADWRGWGCGAAGDPIERPKAFPYTASLDAAMTLVPKGLCWRIVAWPKNTIGPRFGALVEGAPDSFGATPALALCAASLKAKADQ